MSSGSYPPATAAARCARLHPVALHQSPRTFARAGDHRRDVDQCRRIDPRAGESSGETTKRMANDDRPLAVVATLGGDGIGVSIQVGRIILAGQVNGNSSMSTFGHSATRNRQYDGSEPAPGTSKKVVI